MMLMMHIWALEPEKKTNNNGKRVARNTQKLPIDDFPLLDANIQPGAKGAVHLWKTYLRKARIALSGQDMEYMLEDNGRPVAPVKPEPPVEMLPQRMAASGDGGKSPAKGAQQKENNRVKKLNEQQQLEFALVLEEYEVLCQEYEIAKDMNRRNQKILYSKFHKSFSNNSAALDELESMDLESIDDSGTQAVQVMYEWITRGVGMDEKDDTDAYLKQQTEVFKSNVRTQKCRDNVSLLEALSKLEKERRTWTQIFRPYRRDNAEIEANYMAVNDQVEMIRSMLPDSLEFRLVLRDLAPDTEGGKSFEAAVLVIRKYLQDVMSKSEKMKVYSNDGEGAGASSSSSSSPASRVVAMVINGKEQSFRMNDDNDKKWSSIGSAGGSNYWSDKSCDACGQIGHGAGWMQCPQWQPGAGKRDQSRSKRGSNSDSDASQYNNSSSYGNGWNNSSSHGGKGKGKGKAGKGKGKGKGGKGKGKGQGDFRDKSGMQCYACGGWGHGKDDRECPMYSQTQSGPYGKAHIRVAVAQHKVQQQQLSQPPQAQYQAMQAPSQSYNHPMQAPGGGVQHGHSMPVMANNMAPQHNYTQPQAYQQQVYSGLVAQPVVQSQSSQQYQHNNQQQMANVAQGMHLTGAQQNVNVQQNVHAAIRHHQQQLQQCGSQLEEMRNTGKISSLGNFVTRPMPTRAPTMKKQSQVSLPAPVSASEHMQNWAQLNAQQQSNINAQQQYSKQYPPMSKDFR